MPHDFFKLALDNSNEFVLINRKYIVQVRTKTDSDLHGAIIFLEKDDSTNTLLHVKKEDTKELMDWLLEP